MSVLTRNELEVMARACPPPPASPFSGCPAFTLLEVVVALAILASSFSVLLAAHTSSLKLQRQAQQIMVSSLLAREIITKVGVEGVPELGSDEGDFGDDIPDYSWELSSSDTPLGRVKEVTLRVKWLDGNRTEETKLVYYAVE